jgi:hypothetical protein
MGVPLYENQAKDFLWLTSRGVGKAQTLDQLVYGENGPITFADIKVGDSIFDEKGELTNVIAKKYFHNQDVYKITLLDGREVKAGAHHD